MSDDVVLSAESTPGFLSDKKRRRVKSEILPRNIQKSVSFVCDTNELTSRLCRYSIILVTARVIAVISIRSSTEKHIQKCLLPLDESIQQFV